jgi:hypothetical protein
MASLPDLAPNVRNRPTCQQQLDGLEVRWKLVLRALRFFYMSLGSFAAAALISLLGSILTVSALRDGFIAIAVLGLLSGALGVTGLIVGCTILLQETRLAVDSLAEETLLAINPN